MMKRQNSPESLTPLISIYPSSEGHSPPSNPMYSREYLSILDGLDKEESGHMTEKKRRLDVAQVKALEKYFEVEDKLEPERKAKLAQELGLQPRQVAVWFQNRRARWKTKQLERDYGVLKASFDGLKQNYESLLHDKDSLLNKIKMLKSKLNEENMDSDICVKEEALMSESDYNTKGNEPATPPPSLSEQSADAKLMNHDSKVADFKDGPSESDSSAILNEDNNNNNHSPNASNSSCGGGFLQNQQQMCLNSPSLRFNCSSSSMNYLSFNDSGSDGLESGNDNVYHPQYEKLEERNFFSGEETCNLFSDEAAPTLHWYCPDQWT